MNWGGGGGGNHDHSSPIPGGRGLKSTDIKRQRKKIGRIGLEHVLNGYELM